MNEELQRWIDLAWSEIEKLPREIVTDLKTRWAGHKNRNEVVVTFFGPYDSGKSSILKRLLVDEGLPVPEWLTVSGRRETFEAREATLAGMILRDTPGIAGGNELHEQVATAALLLSDYLVVVLPPQLVTSDKEAIFAVLNGSRFGCDAKNAYSDKGISVVLSRMDEAGVMPRENLAEYEKLITRKREEIRQLLCSQSVPECLVAVDVVAADPFGLIGNSIPKGRSDYNADRHWDGIHGFNDYLRHLPARISELRIHCEARFLCAEISHIADSLDGMKKENLDAVDGAKNEATSYKLIEKRLNALLGSARADLNRRIEEEVSSATRRGASNIKELRDLVIGRLNESLDHWAVEQDHALELLFREADSEFKIRRERPSWKKLAETLEEHGESSNADKGDPSDTIGEVQRVSKILHRSFREAQPTMIGMPLEKARSELQRLRQAASFEEYAKQASKGATRFRDAAHAAQARRAVLIDAGFDVAIPAILELGGLIAEVYSERKISEERATQREKIRNSIADATRKLSDRAWSFWCDEGTPSTIITAIKNAQETSNSVVVSLIDEGERISARLAMIRELQGRISTIR